MSAYSGRGHWPRRRLSIRAASISALVGVCVVSLGACSDTKDTRDQSLTDVEWVARAAGIGVGEISQLRPGSIEEKQALTVSVTRWLKQPERSTEMVTFEAMSGAFTGDPKFKRGDKILFLLQDIPSEPAEVFRAGSEGPSRSAAEAEELIKMHLPEAQETQCPSFWRDRARD